MLMVRSLERGLSLANFEIMTVGMIMDYIITYNNLNLEEDTDEGTEIEATQVDFDNF